jgi:hypothetical protein
MSTASGGRAPMAITIPMPTSLLSAPQVVSARSTRSAAPRSLSFMVDVGTASVVGGMLMPAHVARTPRTMVASSTMRNSSEASQGLMNLHSIVAESMAWAIEATLAGVPLSDDGETAAAVTADPAAQPVAGVGAGASGSRDPRTTTRGVAASASPTAAASPTSAAAHGIPLRVDSSHTLADAQLAMDMGRHGLAHVGVDVAAVEARAGEAAAVAAMRGGPPRHGAVAEILHASRRGLDSTNGGAEAASVAVPQSHGPRSRSPSKPNIGGTKHGGAGAVVAAVAVAAVVVAAVAARSSREAA